MPKKKEDRERTEALSELRRKHWKEVFKDNMKVWKEIRDNPLAKDKDRTEAAKCLARQLDIISPEKVQSVPKTSGGGGWLESVLSPEDQEDIERIINPPKPS